jgi:hypothetical protein
MDAKFIDLPSPFTKPLEYIFLLLPNFHRCQVNLANCWRCSNPHVFFGTIQELSALFLLFFIKKVAKEKKTQ